MKSRQVNICQPGLGKKREELMSSSCALCSAVKTEKARLSGSRSILAILRPSVAA